MSGGSRTKVDNWGVDPGRAETHLRRLAEVELRYAPAPPVEHTWRHSTERLAQVARALTTVGALDGATADAILTGFELALAVRQLRLRPTPIPSRPPRIYRAMFAANPTRKNPQNLASTTTPDTAPDRVVPVGMMIPIVDEEVRGELYLLAFSQTRAGARIGLAASVRGGIAAGMHILHRLTVTDDQGTSYVLNVHGRGGPAGTAWTGALGLIPDPPPGIRWLDLTGLDSGTRRIALGAYRAPAVTLTEVTRSPGEYLLDHTAIRILAAALELTPGRRPELALHHPEASDGLGDVVAALQAAAALSPLSPVPGQLATLCESLGLRDHGITAAPDPDLPKPWLSLLSHALRRRPDFAPPTRGCADLAVALPEVDGIRFHILGLLPGEDGTVLRVHASGAPPLPELNDASLLPTLWLRDDAGRWHAACVRGWNGEPDGEVSASMWIAPPLTRTASIEIIAAGRSAEARVTLPLRWR
jgi:hypothetical protein